MAEVDDVNELKLGLEQLRGAINTLTAEFKAGDRNGEAGVRLLAQQVKAQGDVQVQQREDLKEALARFDLRTEEIRKQAQLDVSAVRVDLERQMEVHEQMDAPHARSLGRRLDIVEGRINRAWGGMAVVGFIGLSGVAALVKQLIGGG